MIQFPIRNRWTGDVQFTATIAADESALTGVKIGLAVRWAIENRASLDGANLDGAYLTGANLDGAYLAGASLDGAYLTGASLDGASLDGAYLTGAYLTGASLDGANLTGANLARAYLTGANLDGAYLAGANLDGAYLTGASLARANLTGALVRGEKVCRVVAIASRIHDPYQFTAFELKAGGVKVLAGCRWFSIEAYREHVADEYPDTDKGRETLDILAFIETRAAALSVPVEQAA